jgi:hypothetical protein
MSLPKYICWQIWLVRNRSVFKEEEPSISRIISTTKSQLMEFLNSRCMKLSSPQSLDGIEHRWFDKFQIQFLPPSHAQVRSGWKLHFSPIDFLEWIKIQDKHLLCFDGVSKGNPGVAGVEGVILDPEDIR